MPNRRPAARATPPGIAPRRTKLTPPEVAQRYGVDPAKILTWIRAGELRAMNAATTRGGRPRYLIDEADLADFELGRSATPPPKPQRKRRETDADVIEFF